MNKNVSIIVPVHNSSKYLSECLQSIKNQTYYNFEIILIDDGSTDNSADICEKFCLTEKRAILFRNDNHGVSYSRNFGILHSKFELICFIDSDDIIDKCFLEKLVSKTDDNDIVFCRFSRFTFLENKSKYFETKLEEFISAPSSIEYLFIENKYLIDNDGIVCDKIFGSCCRSIFKKEIILKNSIKFPENVVLGEDTIFLMKYLIHCRNAALIDEYLYFYRDTLNSAVKKYASNYIEDFYRVRISTLKNEILVLSPLKEKYYSLYLINYLKMQFNFAFVINEIKVSDKHSIKELNNISNKEYREFLKFKIFQLRKISKFSLKRMILLFLIKNRNYKLLKLLFRRNK